MNWHHLHWKEVLEITGSSATGLTSQTAAVKLAEYGPNELEVKKKKSPLILFIRQFSDFMILVLLAAAVVAGFTGNITDSIIILVIVLLNAIVGFVQEYRAEKAVESLRSMAALQAKLMRDNQPAILPAAAIVPGDIVLLEAGNIIPADIRLMESFSLQVDESALTGESVPLIKSTETIEEPDTPVAERTNMVFKSCIVTNGRATGIAVATGMQTEIGMIARMLQQEEAVTPLQQRMTDFGKKLSYIIIVICLLLFFIGILRGEQPLNMLLVAISLAVAAIPEALPALITIALAAGAKRLAKKNALVRKLPAVETLGSVTYICTDKTGTLTQNKMEVTAINETSTQQLFSTCDTLKGLMALNHDITFNQDAVATGDPTEKALVRFFISNYDMSSYEKIRLAYPRAAELPFDADRKCMTTVHRYQAGYLVIAKGAPEAIAAIVDDPVARENIYNTAANWSAEGKRVIAYGYKMTDHLPRPFSYEKVECHMTSAGLAAMTDPPRREVSAAIRECKCAGITPVMITGDHPATAAAIARQIGILGNDKLLVTGKELSAMTEDEFSRKAEHICVYARVSPEQKLQIVKMLQKKNHFVAMTGDGVNDAPSLNSANIGIAMGITGTDVSREAAHMILLDDNFASIVKAVKEGRRIYDNIRKFVKYIMTCNGAEIWTLFLAPFLGLPIPLLPIHILWINLVTDGLPGLALAGEKAERNIMQRKPRKTNESLFAEATGYHIVWVGLLMAAVTLCTQAWAMNAAAANWQTMVFTVLSLSQLGHVLSVRSSSEFLYQQGIFSNRFLAGAVVLTFLLQLGVIYLPGANIIFKTHPLTLTQLLICIVLSAVVFHAVELEKYIKKRMQQRSITATSAIRTP